MVRRKLAVQKTNHGGMDIISNQVPCVEFLNVPLGASSSAGKGTLDECVICVHNARIQNMQSRNWGRGPETVERINRAANLRGPNRKKALTPKKLEHMKGTIQVVVIPEKGNGSIRSVEKGNTSKKEIGYEAELLTRVKADPELGR